MHYGTETALKTLAKITALAAGAGLALFGAYTLVWRSHFCAELASLNVLAPPSDINSDIMQRIGFRKLCGLSDYFSSAFLVLIMKPHCPCNQPAF